MSVYAGTSTISSMIKAKRTTHSYSIRKWLNHKQIILKAARDKQLISYNGSFSEECSNLITLVPVFSSETRET